MRDINTGRSHSPERLNEYRHFLVNPSGLLAVCIRPIVIFMSIIVDTPAMQSFAANTVVPSFVINVMKPSDHGEPHSTALDEQLKSSSS